MCKALKVGARRGERVLQTWVRQWYVRLGLLVKCALRIKRTISQALRVGAASLGGCALLDCVGPWCVRLGLWEKGAGGAKSYLPAFGSYPQATIVQGGQGGQRGAGGARSYLPESLLVQGGQKGTCLKANLCRGGKTLPAWKLTCAGGAKSHLPES